MKFVLIYGPQAVGKMTVGQELSKITGLKLFHNHITIEMLEPLFGFTPEMWQLSDLFRSEIFKAYAASDQEGLIFSFVWAFNEEADWNAVEIMTGIFREVGADIFFVELEAEVEERLIRNKSANRLVHKPTKRNTSHSERELLRTMDTIRLNSYEGEIQEANYLRINNTHLHAAEVAQKIVEAFELPQL
ncbi:AAA domain-containing protein [Lentibacillus persicus]|uniref:AAA domain-containing protein n=1 Tax=Lentibacillus persicus TaxID=640948 RepID=A0A1I1SBR4_9BACI|nr:AAA family ATPase [Lentibacillus persicus]SFD43906.1 AAA domain-containing protein [Lentibacillus persicus]